MPKKKISEKEAKAAHFTAKAFRDLSIAFSSLGTTPGVQDEFKNALALMSGIAHFKDKENLWEHWKHVDWSKNPVVLAEMVVGSGQKEIIKEAKIDWLTLMVPNGSSSQEKNLWFVETFMPQISHHYTSYGWPFAGGTRPEDRALNEKIETAFWDALFEKNVFSEKARIQLPGKDEKSLLALAFSAGHVDLLTRLDWEKNIKDKEEAESVLYGFLCNQSYRMMQSPQAFSSVKKCFSFAPDLLRHFKNEQEDESRNMNIGILQAEFMAFSEYRNKRIYQEMVKEFVNWIKNTQEKNQTTLMRDLQVRSGGSWIFNMKDSDLIVKNLSDKAKRSCWTMYFVDYLKEISKSRKNRYTRDEFDDAGHEYLLSALSNASPSFGAAEAKAFILFDDRSESQSKLNVLDTDAEDEDTEEGFFDTSNDFGDDEEDIFTSSAGKSQHNVKIETSAAKKILNIFDAPERKNIEEFLKIMNKTPSLKRDLEISIFRNNYKQGVVPREKIPRKI